MHNLKSLAAHSINVSPAAVAEYQRAFEEANGGKHISYTAADVAIQTHAMKSVRPSASFVAGNICLARESPHERLLLPIKGIRLDSPRRSRSKCRWSRRERRLLGITRNPETRYGYFSHTRHATGGSVVYRHFTGIMVPVSFVDCLIRTRWDDTVILGRVTNVVYAAKAEKEFGVINACIKSARRTIRLERRSR